MKTKLANQLLRALVDMDEEMEAQIVPKLRAMAELKWDTYEGFRAGQRFMESLARWLPGFAEKETRLRWLQFLLDDLVFVSAPEVDHLIAVSYPDYIRPAVLERVAAAGGIPTHLKARLLNSSQFQIEQRRLLVLGLSDGARLDVLRRNSSLSHEQFVPGAEVPEARRHDLREKLVDALATFEKSPAGVEETFNHILLVDDFYGSGTSLIDFSSDAEGNSMLKGKIKNIANHAASLTKSSDAQPPFLAENYGVTILLYMASSRAKRHIEESLKIAKLDEQWKLEVIQVFDEQCEVKDSKILEDCDDFWDPVLEDRHKKRAARGYKDCALPLVIYHNSPNNSVSPLWADSTGRRRQGVVSQDRRALFPRYERHHSDRP